MTACDCPRVPIPNGTFGGITFTDCFIETHVEVCPNRQRYGVEVPR